MRMTLFQFDSIGRLDRTVAVPSTFMRFSNIIVIIPYTLSLSHVWAALPAFFLIKRTFSKSCPFFFRGGAFSAATALELGGKGFCNEWAGNWLGGSNILFLSIIRSPSPPPLSNFP